MTRRASPSRIEAAALEAGRRRVARGERPGYRVRNGQNGRWEVLGCPRLSIDANDRRSAVEAMRTAVAR
jgi:hypothetical protein